MKNYSDIETATWGAKENKWEVRRDQWFAQKDIWERGKLKWHDLINFKMTDMKFIKLNVSVSSYAHLFQPHLMFQYYSHPFLRNDLILLKKNKRCNGTKQGSPNILQTKF